MGHIKRLHMLELLPCVFYSERRFSRLIHNYPKTSFFWEKELGRYEQHG